MLLNIYILAIAFFVFIYKHVIVKDTHADKEYEKMCHDKLRYKYDRMVNHDKISKFSGLQYRINRQNDEGEDKLKNALFPIFDEIGIKTLIENREECYFRANFNDTIVILLLINEGELHSSIFFGSFDICWYYSMGKKSTRYQPDINDARIICKWMNSKLQDKYPEVRIVPIDYTFSKPGTDDYRKSFMWVYDDYSLQEAIKMGYVEDETEG